MSTEPQTKAKVPPAPEGFDPEALFKGVIWYQKWEVFKGIFTPGINPISEICDLLNLPADLSGKRVLDIGSSNGCMSLECERRGAAEVVALTPLDSPEWGHHQLRDALGATRTHFRPGSVYDLDPSVLGYFDTVLFCGVLYHLRYPMLAIDNIRRVARDQVFIETHISDNGLSPDDNAIPLWRFYRFDELNKDHSNWFGPNTRAVLEALESAGFSVKPLFNSGQRATFQASVREGMPEFLSIPCHEAGSYDLMLKHIFGEKETWRRPIPTQAGESN